MKIIKFEKSPRKHKKIRVHFKLGQDKIHTVDFGDTRFEHYHDRTGLYPELNHSNLTRQKRYLARAKKIKNKFGFYTYKNPLSPNYWSVNFLW